MCHFIRPQNQKNKMNQEINNEVLINLGLDEDDVRYLIKLTDKKSIKFKKDFLQITSYKINDEDRDEYSLAQIHTGKYKDIYHDNNFKNELSIRFLRSIRGMHDFLAIDDGHCKAIKYNFSNDQELELRYKNLMSKFWADKILSGPIRKFLAARLRKIKNIDLRDLIHENLILVGFGEKKVLDRFFNGEALKIIFDVERHIEPFKKLQKYYKINDTEFHNKYETEYNITRFKNYLLNEQDKINENFYYKYTISYTQQYGVYYTAEEWYDYYNSFDYNTIEYNQIENCYFINQSGEERVSLAEKREREEEKFIRENKRI